MDKAKQDLLEQQVRFLLAENIRLNEVVRELVFFNDLRRHATGVQTTDSFDFQWKEIPEGRWMPSNPEFLRSVAGQVQEWLQLPKEWFRGKRALDAGCGSGRWTYALLQLGANVTAVDQSPSALEEVRKLTQGMGEIRLERQNLLEMSVEQGAYDLVWCFGVAHHTENPIKVLKGLTRAVAPGGHLFVMLYGFPTYADAFREQASYAEWREKLMPLPNREKVKVLAEHYAPDLVHGYFDAVSPQINDLFTFDWIRWFLQNEGFDSVRRAIPHPNHYVVARKTPGGS